MTTATATGEVLLEVRDLRYAFGARTAVAGVSFAVRRGEIFGLLGPNGAGKTTTISCIAGLRRPAGGDLRFRDQPFTPAQAAADRARLGVVPQELALYEALTARENLQFFAGLAGVPDGQAAAAVERALELSGLADRADERVASYSGGMKRRLNLAVGDLHQPDLLILDEPTVGVDPQSRNHIFDALAQVRQAGRTLLYTTHYMEEAQRLCDRVAIMDEGRIIDCDTPDGLARNAGIPGADLERVFLTLTGKRLRD